MTSRVSLTRMLLDSGSSWRGAIYSMTLNRNINNVYSIVENGIAVINANYKIYVLDCI